MAIQQGSGYRDPTKALSIKALQARAKSAAEASAQATQMTTPIADPWQGAAHLGNILATGMNQGVADRQESAGRQQLAAIRAGIDLDKGATSEQIAQMGALDDEAARQAYETAMSIRNREDEQTFRSGERVAGQEFTTSERTGTQDFTSTQNDLNRQADIARQKLSDANAAGRQDDAQEATRELAELNAQLDTEKARTAAEIKVEAIPAETAARELEAERQGMVKGTPEWNEFVLTGDYPTKPASTNIYNQGDQPAFSKKSDELAAVRLGETVTEGRNASDFIGQVRMVADLGKSIGTGKWAQVWNQVGPYLEMTGLDIEGLGESQAYEAITNKMAPAMRPAGSGPTSNYDAKQFLMSLQQLGNDPRGNQIIEATFEALTQNKIQAADIAAKAQSQQINPATGKPYTWWEAEEEIRALPNPYDTFKAYKKDLDAGTTGTDTGGEGGTYQPPMFDPATDEEGDTGTDEKGTWTVQGGKWVLTAPAGQ